jgi:hypothetical protein
VSVSAGCSLKCGLIGGNSIIFAFFFVGAKIPVKFLAFKNEIYQYVKLVSLALKKYTIEFGTFYWVLHANKKLQESKFYFYSIFYNMNKKF